MVNIKKLISNISGKGLKDDRNLKSIYKIGNLYSNIRNVGLLYKYYGNLTIAGPDFLKFMEFLNNSSKHNNPLRCEIIIKNDGNQKSYYICFWYGSTLGYNSYQAKDHREVFDHYYALNGLRQTIQNMNIFANKLEYVDYFSFFPQTEGSKNGLDYMNDAINKLVKGKNEFIFEKKVNILRDNLIGVLEERGINKTNYQFSIGKDLYGKNLSFSPTTVEERFYEKMLAFGFYMGDNDFYFPLGVKGIPFETSNELIVEFDINKFLQLLDTHLESGTFYNYSVNITFSPTNGIQVGSDNKYKIGTDRARIFDGITQNKDFIYGTTFMLNLFSKENDISRFYRDVDAAFQQHIELAPLDGLIDANEGFMVQNDYFNMAKFYSTQDNLKDYFYTMKQYKAPMKDGVYLGVDFFSKNPFVVNLLDMVGKGDGGKDRTLQGAPHALVVGGSGSGKTFLMKKFYEGVTAEQLLVLDNKGNFQEIDPSKRGLVLKYGKDIASIFGTIKEGDIVREDFLLYGNNSDKFNSNIVNMLIKRGNTKLDISLIDSVSKTFLKFGKWDDDAMKLLDIDLGSLNVIKSQFNSTVQEAIDEIMISQHYKRKLIENKITKVVYNENMKEEALINIEKELKKYLFTFISDNIDEQMLIEDFRKYLDNEARVSPIYQQIKSAISSEMDFPNFIGVINENNRTTKEYILEELLLGGNNLEEVYKTQIRGIISQFFLKNDFFRYDYFYQFVESNTNIDINIKRLLIPLLDALDSRTVSILNRTVSLMEDVLASGMYQKIIISNEYIMNEMKNATTKGILTSVLLDSMYGYVELVKAGKIDNKFDYTMIMIDEAHNYLQNEYIVNRIDKGIRELRNNRGSIILISQSYTDFKMINPINIGFRLFVSHQEYLNYKESITDESVLEKLNSLNKGIEQWSEVGKKIQEIELKTGQKNPDIAYKQRFFLFLDNKSDPYLLYPKF